MFVSMPTAPKRATWRSGPSRPRGVYIGGGIAPKILPALEAGTFLDAFLAKRRCAISSRRFPSSVILNPDAGLVGAAVHAQHLAQQPLSAGGFASASPTAYERIIADPCVHVLGGGRACV